MTRKPYQLRNDKWMLGEDIPDCDLFFAQIWLTGFTNEFIYPSGRSYKRMLTVFRGQHLWFYFGEKDSYEVGEHIAKKFLRTPSFARLVNTKIVTEADTLRNFAESIPQAKLAALSNRQLWDTYRRHDACHTQYYRWCWIPVAADMFHNNLTSRLNEYLRSLRFPDGKLSEYFILLTQPTKKSLIQIEHEDFLRIAAIIQKHKKSAAVLRSYYVAQHKRAVRGGLVSGTPEYERFLERRAHELLAGLPARVLKLLEKHYLTYYYVKFMWIGKEGVSSFDYYVKEMAKLLGGGIDTRKELKRLQKEFVATRKSRAALLRKLSIREPWRTLLDAWGDFMVTKIYRRYAQIYEIYRMQPVMREIARRLRLTPVQAKFMLKDEVKAALLRGNINRGSLKMRTKSCVFYNDKNKELIYTGKQAGNIAKSLYVAHSADTAEFKGQTGCVGKAAGTVKIVIRPKDMHKMNKGDILVSIATDPDIVPAMKKAAAIVTEQGGVTSHAAIVSREMNIPCVIGTKIATRVLKDGDRVEVDATKGIVKKI